MKREFFTKKRIVWLSALSGAILLHLLFFALSNFADIFNTYISQCFRFVLAKITDIFPFSLGEILIYSAVPLAVIIAVIAIKKEKTLKNKLIFVLENVLKILIVIYVLFVVTFAPGYNSHPLDEKLGFQRNTVSDEELYSTLVYVIEKANECANLIDYEENGESFMPFELDALSDKLCQTYAEVYKNYDLNASFNSNVKPLIISPIMTYTHISGVYSFFTGEANLNTNYPDFVNVFSASHELAHQRGIAREDEANFMAYLICISSDDAYIRYSGYLNMYSYLSDALYSSNPEFYKQALSLLSDDVKGELIAYSNFFDKYRDNTASTVSDAVNDAYLKSQGTSGSISYGMVVGLAVSYHKDHTDK